MAYSMLFVDNEPLTPASTRSQKRAVGENVFLANLPVSPKVFALFYQGDADTDEIETGLRALGERTGENFFINFGTLADPHFKQAVTRFRIGSLPAIVITAVSPLAATPDGTTAYVRLDGRALFGKPSELIQTIEELFNLFLGEKIRDAIVFAWTQEGKAKVTAALERVWAVIGPIVSWAARKDIEVEFAAVKIKITDSESPQ